MTLPQQTNKRSRSPKCCRMLPSPSVSQSTDLGALPRFLPVQLSGAYYSLGPVRWRTSGRGPWPSWFPQARLTFSAAEMRRQRLTLLLSHPISNMSNYRLSRWTFTKVIQLLVTPNNMMKKDESFFRGPVNTRDAEPKFFWPVSQK